MNEIFATVSGIISGGCLLAIAIRSRMPFFGSIISQKSKKNLDFVDKILSFFAFIFFIICMVLTMLMY